MIGGAAPSMLSSPFARIAADRPDRLRSREGPIRRRLRSLSMVGKARKRLRAFLERSGRRRWTDTNLMTSCWSGAAMMSSRLGQSSRNRRPWRRTPPSESSVRAGPRPRPNPDGRSDPGRQITMSLVPIRFSGRSHGSCRAGRAGEHRAPRHWIESGRPFR